MRDSLNAHNSLMRRYSRSFSHLRVRNSKIALRPEKISLRFRQRLSKVYARLTFSGLREFQPSSAARTLRTAVSCVNGGTGGRTSDICNSPVDVSDGTQARLSVGASCRCAQKFQKRCQNCLEQFVLGRRNNKRGKSN